MVDAVSGLAAMLRDAREKERAPQDEVRKDCGLEGEAVDAARHTAT